MVQNKTGNKGFAFINQTECVQQCGHCCTVTSIPDEKDFKTAIRYMYYHL